MPNAGQPTFPVSSNRDCDYPGLTKREYFAAMAMQGVIAHYGLPKREDDGIGSQLVNPDEIASFTGGCLLAADELLRQLETK